MLDVHPPHNPTHTWKDFFIHIATIVIGLLIAIGLEQTVEYIHHRHQVQELREALKHEREENRKIFAANVVCFRYDRAILKNNLRILLYLQQHPATPEEKLPGSPVWRQILEPVLDPAYRNAQQSQTLSMLPQKECEALSKFYGELTSADQSALAAAETGLKAGQFNSIDPDPSHLSSTQLDKNIGLLTDALYLNLKWGLWLWHIGEDNETFAGAPTRAEFNETAGFIRSPEDQKKLAVAQAQTEEALRSPAAAIKALYDTAAPPAH
jgi:hypothetical protein